MARLVAIAIATALSACSTRPSPVSRSVDAGGDSAGDVGAAPPAVPQAGLGFSLELSPDTDFKCNTTCWPAMLYVAAASDEKLDVVWGNPNGAESATLLPVDGGWELQAPIRLGGSDDSPYCSSQLTTATFELADHDLDGLPDWRVAGAQNTTTCFDDYVSFDTSKVEFRSAPDARAPEAYLLTAGYDGVAVRFTEPLVASASATLSVQWLSPAPAVKPIVDEGYVVGFSADTILPFGVALGLSFSGTDLSGVGTPSALAASTLSDPGVFPQDGFESGTIVGVSAASGTTVVSDYKGIPAMAGNAMLYLRGYQLAFIHLRRAGSEAAVTFKARKVSSCGNGTGQVLLSAGVVGGTKRAEQIWEPQATVPANIGYEKISEIEQVSLPLVDSGKDVILTLRSECSAMGSPDPDVLMDDLRLE